jgi:hypothetical protein
VRLVTLQPGYLPWCGFFDQMNKADIFVIYDNVQFSKGAWQNRNRIKTFQGIQWLTVPVLIKGKNQPLVKDILIDNSINWRKNHLKSIQQNYSRAPFFKDYFGIFDEVYAQKWEYLIDLDMAFVMELKIALGVETKISISSDLGIEGDTVQRLVNMCLALGADEFLEGSAGRDYLTGEGEQLFRENGIQLTYQDYQHPVYRQLYGEFVPYLSVVDLLMNCGPESLNILTNKKGTIL